ncbi:hypothetical protein [Cryobacterium sp. Hh38]|uniref:hypothetical protein n=1 Tax=Cryobacterium sp. Hh38 TaxID=1259156 RepID=UPI00106D6799|nr:hypothetical protein [Cryobacterium sp. Hh38]TFD57008.1 hypothetical protein E3T41_13420 [Cryobacterium sp. Hh38]
MADEATTALSGRVLQVTDLTVHFGVDNVWVPAALSLNYSIERGNVFAIVGRSDSGKSAS